MMKKRIFACMLVLVLVVSMAVSAQALGLDSAGNGVAGDEAVAGQSIPRDLYWGGQSMSVTDSKIGESLVCAGYDLSVANTTVGGNVRAAGYQVSFQGTQIENNVTAAGYTISFDSASTAAGVYTAATTATFSGVCDTLGAVGATVILNGTVNGDANIAADKVVIGPNAAVTGVLNVSASEEPAVPASAKIADLQFTKNETPAVADVDADAVAVAAKAAAGAAIIHRITSRVYWIFAVAVLALLFMLLIPDSLNGAACMVKNRTLALLLTGFIAVLALPLALLLLCLTYIGLPVAGLLALLSLVAMLFSVPFAGASLGRLVFPKMNAWLAAVLGAAILSAARVIPIVSGLIAFAAIIYTLGYFVQVCYLRMRNRKAAPAAAANPVNAAVIPAPVIPGSVETPEAPAVPAQTEPEQTQN